jgi:hypothetical protein
MRQSLTKLFSLGLMLLTFSQINAANFTFSNTTPAGGNWNVATNWTLNSGTDADNIPDADDNVTIPSGRLCILTAAVACINLIVAPSTTPRLQLRANLTINGTLFGGGATSAGVVSPIVSNSSVSPNFLVFTGVSGSSQRVIDQWDAYPLPSGTTGFNVGFNPSSSGNLIINGDLGCLNMEVATGTVHSFGFIYLGFNTTGAAGAVNTGILTINTNAQLNIEKNIGFRGPGVTTYCQSMIVNGVLEIKSNLSLAAHSIEINSKLRFSTDNTTGMVNASSTNIVWGIGGGIEYANSFSMTPGDELSLTGTLLTDPKNLLGVPYVNVNLTVGTNYVDFTRIFRVNNTLSLDNGQAILSNVLYLPQNAQIVDYANSSKFLRFNGATAKIRKQVTNLGTYTFPVGVANIYTPIEMTLTNLGNATFEEISINKIGGTRPTCLTASNGDNSYRVYHNIGTTYSATTGTIKLSYAQNTASIRERGPNYMPSAARIVRCDGATRRIMSTTSGESSTNSNTLYTVSGNYIGGLYDYFVTSDATILPITLRDFKGKTQGEAALLSWNTEGALNFSHFEIEHNTDGQNWKKLGQRDYYKQVNQYQFKHSDMVSGTNYYRLKQVDLDGSFEYSRVITLNLEDGRTIVSVRPNMVIDQTTVIVNTQKAGVVTLNLVNSVGKIVESKQINAEKGIQEIPFDLSQKPNGIYLISAFEGSTFLENVKLLKAQ